MEEKIVYNNHIGGDGYEESASFGQIVERADGFYIRINWEPKWMELIEAKFASVDFEEAKKILLKEMLESF